jgi:anti-sigma28 factor (negative regulator of flagellin synthesis)
MISNIGSSGIQTAYNLNENKKDLKPNAKVASMQNGSQTKIEHLKESIDSGEYKIDLSALSQKMADELMM